MTSAIPSPVSETARERETFKYDDLEISTARILAAEPSRPIPSAILSSTPDPGLTAFCQLGLYRLKASHALLSLFDRNYQHIVAEAISCAPLSGDSMREDQLVFCGSAVPRATSICEHVLTGPAGGQSVPGTEYGFAPNNLPVSVLCDLDEDPRFCQIKDKNRRFYAGVPIRTPTDINIGVFCVFDNKPRPEGLTEDQIQFIRDISRTIMDYLQAKRSDEWYRREERMVRGLGSFVEGKATLSNWSERFDKSSFQDIPGVREGVLNKKLQATPNHVPPFPPDLEPLREPERGGFGTHQPVYSDSTGGPTPSSEPAPAASQTGTENTSHVSSSDMLQWEVERVFSKAANIIRESIEVEGVLFLDASVRTFGGLIGKEVSEPPILERVPSCESSSDESPPLPDHDEEHTCNVLGFSTSSQSSINGDSPCLDHCGLPEKFLQKLLQRYPHGHIFNFEADEIVSDQGSETYSCSEVDETYSLASPRCKPAAFPADLSDMNISPKDVRKRLRKRRDTATLILKLFPGARSVAIVPLFDAQRNRWFAGGFVWTKTPTRIFTLENELSYIRVFGLTTMAEVARLHARAADKTKTDILGSISHELRSPLHGVVGAVELLRNTVLDGFQENILRTIETSGRTLLDTIDHLLDYSKISNIIRSSNTGRRSSIVSLRSRGKSPNPATLASPELPVHLDRLVEEVVESVLAGYSYRNMADAHFAAWNSFMHASSHSSSRRPVGSQPRKLSSTERRLSQGFDPVHIFLDIDPSANWSFQTHPGAFRRIVMNLFGNSLKFTRAGFIRITLRQETQLNTFHSNSDPRVVLAVSDSGKGISQDYLRHQLFTPFSQEDHFAPGTGLGLSLVRQMTTTLGGNINVSSQVGQGTTITVSLPLPHSRETDEDEAAFRENIQTLAGRRVRLVGFDSATRVREGFRREDVTNKSQLQLMESICRDWLRMEVEEAPTMDTRPSIPPDFVICILDDSSKVRVEDMPDLALYPHMFICEDSTAAYDLTKPNKCCSKMKFACLPQPIGPRKLAEALLTARSRWEEALKSTPPTETGRSGSGATIDDPVLPSSPPPGAILSPQDEPLLQVSQTKSGPVISETSLPIHIHEEPVARAPTTLISPLSPPPTGIVVPSQDGLANAITHAPEARPSILIVDDNAINLKILVAYMVKLKHPHTTAMNGLEAMELYIKSPSEYSCILTDISMPVMDGLESTRRIREFERANRLKPAVVIALTGLSGVDVQQEAFASGVDLFLTRPLVLKGLVDALETMGMR
ncbi:hypothetical protein QBC46DRAFT_389771 [Diplogelasinospora grovesii]|uniref:histidine kinase n=1 Tax=Diplogelasinospora grovesii TaxID=303347 RepID=A0AAN6N501_9PEZI|nr:hypothetical protein QBC46DRAFT_389771 [Diplogelasinospora grovesii]